MFVTLVTLVTENTAKIKIFFVIQKKHYMPLVFYTMESHLALYTVVYRGTVYKINYSNHTGSRFKVQGSRYKGIKPMNEDCYPAWYPDDSHEGFQQWDERGYEEEEDQINECR